MMLNRSDDKNIPSLFKLYGERFFDMYPEVDHLWSVRNDYISLDIPLQSEGGFEIYLQVSEEDISISCAGFHEHYPTEEPHEDFVNQFYGFLYNLLSPVMRIRESVAGVSGHKWELQHSTNNSWETESTTGLLFYNYFAKKSTRTFSNSVLPIRESPLN